MATPRQPEPEIVPTERGSSGFGVFVGIGTAALATVAAVALLGALHVAAPLILLATGGLGLLAGGLLVLQHHKEKTNQAAVRRNYAAREGYHRMDEPERDPSLIHLIKGRSDLPARVQYIKDHYGEYGVKPLSADQYRGKYMGYGLAIGAAVGGVVAVGLMTLTAAAFGAPAVAFAAVMGTLLGGTALALHTAHTMKRYDAYVDAQAAEGQKREQQAEQNRAPEPALEQGNSGKRAQTFCEEVTTRRRQQAAAPMCR